MDDCRELNEYPAQLRISLYKNTALLLDNTQELNEIVELLCKNSKILSLVENTSEEARDIGDKLHQLLVELQG